MTRVGTKFRRALEVYRLYLQHPDGLTDDDLAERFGCNRTTIVRLRQEFDNIRRVRHGYYTINPTPEDVELAEAILKRSQ